MEECDGMKNELELIDLDFLDRSLWDDLSAEYSSKEETPEEKEAKATRERFMNQYLYVQDNEKVCKVCNANNPSFLSHPDELSWNNGCTVCGAYADFNWNDYSYTMTLDDFRWHLNRDELLDETLVQKVGEQQKQVFALYNELLQGVNVDENTKILGELLVEYHSKGS